MRKYKLVAKKGEGTFSEVLKAQNVKDKKYHAIKCMKNRFENIDQVNNLREIQALRRLSPHEHVITLEEVLYDQPTGRLALVFELMDGNLYEIIKGRKHYLNPQLIKSYMWQLMKALDHMHKKGIFHRDIKPENILVESSSEFGHGLKLADFGSCRGIYSKQPYTEYISTRWYRAPECLLTDGYYGPEMDLWGAGCVMFEITSLFPLFPGANEADQIARIHKIIGTKTDALEKLKSKGASHISFDFPYEKGTGIVEHLQHAAPEAIDLMLKQLKYDASERITAREAMNHLYFKEFKLLEQQKQAQLLAQANALAASGGGGGGGGGNATTGSIPNVIAGGNKVVTDPRTFTESMTSTMKPQPPTQAPQYSNANNNNNNAGGGGYSHNGNPVKQQIPAPQPPGGGGYTNMNNVGGNQYKTTEVNKPSKGTGALLPITNNIANANNNNNKALPSITNSTVTNTYTYDNDNAGASSSYANNNNNNPNNYKNYVPAAVQKQLSNKVIYNNNTTGESSLPPIIPGGGNTQSNINALKKNNNIMLNNNNNNGGGGNYNNMNNMMVNAQNSQVNNNNSNMNGSVNQQQNNQNTTTITMTQKKRKKYRLSYGAQDVRNNQRDTNQVLRAYGISNNTGVNNSITISNNTSNTNISPRSLNASIVNNSNNNNNQNNQNIMNTNSVGNSNMYNSNTNKYTKK